MTKGKKGNRKKGGEGRMRQEDGEEVRKETRRRERERREREEEEKKGKREVEARR